MATKYRLGSSEAVYSPGIIRWAVNGYAFEDDREKLLNVITATWSSIPRETAHKLLSGEIPYTVEGESVVFETTD
ncbi:MAG: hypothetical protein ABF479_11315 [Gluconacetobacter sp.]